MLDFTCCVMFFNYWLTKVPGGAALTRPTLHFPLSLWERAGVRASGRTERFTPPAASYRAGG
jgi:hypothetical protein